ncbi:MAG: hypothetical protein JWQ38_2957 [Flavipsychrobacter sp.]|nr:hypothetical protein [Flavipsychrobacter sp.]
MNIPQNQIGQLSKKDLEVEETGISSYKGCISLSKNHTF